MAGAILVAVGVVVAALGRSVWATALSWQRPFTSGSSTRRKSSARVRRREESPCYCSAAGYTPDWLDWAINERTLDWIVQIVFNCTKKKLEDYMEKKSVETTQTVARFGKVGEGKNGRKE